MADDQTTSTPPASSSGGGNNTPVLIGALVGGLVIGAAITYFAVGGGAPDQSGPDPVVARYRGVDVKGSEAYAPIKTRLFDLEEEMFRTKESAVNDYIEQRLLEEESRKQNLPLEALLDKEAGKAADASITDKDIEAFLTSKGLSLDDPRIRKEDVRDYLKYRKRFERRQEYVKKLRAQANVQIFLKEPESPKLHVKVDGYPTWGNPGAPVTVVEFSDFQCPFCSRVVPTLAKIKKEYGPDKVKIVFRDMPLPSHKRAPAAAMASHCANEQGKFWEYHDKLFENQSGLEDKDLKKYAADLKLDGDKFAECYDSAKYKDKVDASRREAEALGIQATPSFVINGALLQGAQPFERFKEKIDRHLRKMGKI